VHCYCGARVRRDLGRVPFMDAFPSCCIAIGKQGAQARRESRRRSRNPLRGTEIRLGRIAASADELDGGASP
jgi:hypothetical protein